MSEFSHLKNKLLAEQVEDQIYHYILDTPLEPGAKLPNEFALAEKFRVGRSTIREAVKLLSSKGIVEVRQGSGNPFLEKAASVPDYSPIYDAPAMIVVSAETTEDTMAVGMNTANCACAAQNMLLAATELGLGSCYIVSGTLAFMVPEVKATAGIAENMTPSCAVVIGYTEDSAPHTERHENPNNIIYCR